MASEATFASSRAKDLSALYFSERPNTLPDSTVPVDAIPGHHKSRPVLYVCLESVVTAAEGAMTARGTVDW